MSFERVTAGTSLGAEPAPSPSPAANEQGIGTSAAMRLQILSTEHWSLLATRSLSWNETFSRAGMFLSALSGAIVALALVAQASEFGQGFVLFALVILPVVLFIGVTTFLRLGAANYYDATCVIGMNRIRAAYLELAPELERYFVMSAHDDIRGVGISMGVQPETSQVVHLFAATPVMVVTLNSVIVAALVALIGLQLQAEAVLAVALGVLGFAASMAVLMSYARRHIRRSQVGFVPLFPSGEALE